MSPTLRPDTSLIRSAVVARIVTTSPHDWSLPTSTARATSCSRMATLGRARSRGVLGSELPEERPTVRRRARSVAGLRGMMPSRTASLSTRTSAETVFLIVDRPNSVSHWSMARSTRPAVIIATGR
jgi:hypothetical protein